MPANSDPQEKVYIGSLFQSEPESLLDSINHTLIDVKDTAQRAKTSPSEDTLALTNLDAQAAKLLMKRVATVFPATNTLLSGSLAKRLLKKDEVCYMILAVLQVVFGRISWGLLSTIDDDLERQRVRMIIAKIRELSIKVCNETYLLPQKPE